ncbi:hypothetical protein FIBSPDRAFT_815741 [Athelia psychrophila]|uniref:BTB domain-containing protein n=1 Tax=Athelia psychrophila TaxID=1759441 RepID=A0A166SNY2_9AGAM|nr:hypothetical protein FIBSPDRAFT_815741 [Fibularhizoctonia sp. CBS 109695]
MKARELEAKGAQEQRDAEAKERDAILFSTPIITSVSPRRRSPSLESISSVTSAFSFNDDPGTTSSSPTISVQGAPQGVDTFFIQGEQEDGLHERDRIKTTASPRDDEQLKSVGASQVLTGSDAYPMHERFCFPAENIYFLVQGVLYSVHRYFFERDSSSFVGQGLSKQEPMVLANVSTHDFDLFLSILYPTSFGVYPASTVEEWSGILHLADKWSFLSIRALAIAQIAPIASPIDKIVFGRLYGVNEWLVSAYHAVCTRPDALTLEEGRRLGVDDVIRINAIRQEFCFVRVSESSPKLFEEDVESRFGLAIQTEHSAKRKSMKDVADKLMADDAAKAKSKKEQEVKAVEIERQKTEQQAANDAAEAKSKKEQEVNAVEIERQKTEQQAAEKRHKEEAEKEANELERGKRVREQREAEAKWKKEEEALAAETERMKRGLELEYRRAQEQREAEARSKQVAAKVAEIERQQRQQEAADMKAKYRAREQREAEAKAADIERKNAETAANSKSLKDTLTTTDLLTVSRSLRAYLTPPSRTPTI